ncbi:LamG domain-containing protein [Streptomyces marispadix]|uniref:LamG domain-containing protein n=1 Tax=Streptomyces marispadix TaxID=2922868 RepID=A0ABS9T3J7_9ACTN|nr:LamG domain-containing protein [Streptomyces marispadix]MCH6163095.1 LamG domain-containing protein [Streptomyces marispadix]
MRAFAATCAAHPTAAEQLAYQAWEEALRERVDGSATGAVRPCVLSSVLRAASGWTRGHQRTELDPQLTAWIDANGPVMLGNTATAYYRRPSFVALAFAGLPHHSQAVLWHQAVERDDAAFTGRLIGSGPGDVYVLSGRAQEDLYNSYARLLRDGMHQECRRFHVLVLAYADAGSLDIASQLAPHLDRCPRCSQAVADLSRVRRDCGALVAQALLPWAGAEYAAREIDESARPGLMPDEAAPGFTFAYDPPGLPAPPMPVPALPPHETAPVPLPGAFAAASPPVTGTAAGKGRHAAAGAAGGASMKGRRRTDLAVRGAAVAGVCAVAAAFAFGVDFGSDKEPQSKEQASPQPAEASPSSSKSPSPKPSSTKARPTASKSAGRTESPKPRPPKPEPTRSERPAVASAAVEWLFDDVDGDGLTADSSGNNQVGTLFGASRPTPTKSGGLEFDGEQFVASDGALVDTSESFSVSARVKLDRTDVSQTVVSQDGDDASAFMLRYDAEETRWEMRLPEEDTGVAEGDADAAVSASGVEAGEWTHLTGIYDDTDDQVRLYVDGRRVQTVGREDDFDTEGDFVVGRGLSNNQFFQGLDGTVDDVQAFGRALTSPEVDSLARKSR